MIMCKLLAHFHIHLQKERKSKEPDSRIAKPLFQLIHIFNENYMYKALVKFIEITEAENYKSGCRHFFQSALCNCAGRKWIVL
jgi:hypothetical protein